MSGSGRPEVELVETTAQLEEVARAASRADVVALDTEGNGLYAYEARLCTMQLAWGEGPRIAVVDTLVVHPAPLALLLGPEGPEKLLHDLTFDARMLRSVEIELGRARDTSVLARMLGRKETGLAALLEHDLGVHASKALQQHDWSRRPLGAKELEYLATDVAHLRALDQALMRDAEALGISEEVRTECAFKLEAALGPPRPPKAAHLRAKGTEGMSRAQREALRALLLVREDLARAADVPPFKVTPNEVLVEVARRSAGDAARLDASLLPESLRARAALRELIDSARCRLARGLEPEEEPRGVRLDRTLTAARQARRRRLTGWRRTEAASRGVDEQVVLPGHCLQVLTEIDEPSVEAIAQVPGFGSVRLTRYGVVLLSLLRGDFDV